MYVKDCPFRDRLICDKITNMLRKDPFITGQYYHIYNRGIDKRLIFNSEKDYKRFIVLLYVVNSSYPVNLDGILNREHKKYDEVFGINIGENLVSIGAWCLMPNHFHILIKQEIDGGITKFMKKLSTGYAMYFNKKYERQGALLGGPFKSKLIGEDDNYMRQLFAYIHLNPLELSFPEWENNRNGLNQVEAKKFLDLYRYSSFQDHIGVNRAEKSIINLNNFPDYFKTTQSFKDFIENYFSTINKVSN